MRCPNCGTTDQFRKYGRGQFYWSLECNACKSDLDEMHVKQMKEIESLREALSGIVTQTNHCPYSTDDASCMIFKACTMAKEALEEK
ncbi:MAG: hypothetical protein GY750_20860 [Lentisphaerae bacterium]|nr:hypothetical protein [Lentisphaerota bacterium]